MLYFTPKQDFKLLNEYDRSMQQIIGEIGQLRRAGVRSGLSSNYELSNRLGLEPKRLSLERSKRRVNEAAWRYASEPPWDEALVRLEHISEYLDEDDPLHSQQYNGKMQYLLSTVESRIHKDYCSLVNPFAWPALAITSLIVPPLKYFSPIAATGFSKFMETIWKLLAGFVAVVVLMFAVGVYRHESLTAVVEHIIAFVTRSEKH